MSSGPVAIVAGHGDFAAGMISAVAQITGQGDRLVPMSNRGLSAADIEEAMVRLLEAHGVRYIFTDLPAGSCTVAATRLARSRAELTVVTGVNLAVLLHFALEASPSVEHAVERAVASMRIMHGTPRAH
ncbi:MAG TPA: hypothetical protein VJ596_04905 [Gemmatimonadaceae bacterium]|nr:hypothetical protein [Gemmatimonadaceae bacterium]